MLASRHVDHATQAPVTHFPAEQCCLTIDRFSLAYAGKPALQQLTLHPTSGDGLHRAFRVWQVDPVKATGCTT